MIKLTKLLFEAETEVKQKQGAGVLLFAEKQKTFLVLKRSNWVPEPGTWGVAGGSLEPGETVMQALQREVAEEVGPVSFIDLIPAFVWQSPDLVYHNFIGTVDSEFEPDLSINTEAEKLHQESENVEYKWVTLDELISIPNKHYGLMALIENSSGLLERLVAKPKTKLRT